MYSMFDLICDVITCYVWSCDTGKINAFDKIMFENQKKRENMKIKDIFLHKSSSKRSFRHRIHSLQRQTDARGSADISYHIWRISLVCGLVIVIRSKNRSRIEYLTLTNTMIVFDPCFNLTNKYNLTDRL